MFYAAKSYMGVNFTFDSDCWEAYAFATKKLRDEWVEDNEYRDNNRVAIVCTRGNAYKIARINSMYKYADIDSNTHQLTYNWR